MFEYLFNLAITTGLFQAAPRALFPKDAAGPES